MKKYILSHPVILSLTVLSGFAMKGIEIYARLVDRNIVDAVMAGERSQFFSYLWIAAAIVLASWLGIFITVNLGNIYSSKSQMTISKNFFDSVFGKKISDFNFGNSAKYISMLNLDIKTISVNYFNIIPQLSREIIGVVAAVVVMGTISPLNAIFVFLTALIPLLSPAIYGRKLAKKQLQVSDTGISLNSKAKDYLSGFDTIKTFGVESHIKPRLYNSITKHMGAMIKSGSAEADSRAFTMGISKIVTLANLFIAGYFVLLGDITVGELVAITGLSLSISMPIAVISDFLSTIRSTKEIAKRITDVIDEKDTKVRESKITTLKSNIEIKNLSFKYESEDSQKTPSPAVLKNISYTFEKGCKYAVVGMSGSGKSTLAKLLMGHYDNYSGEILINGSNIQDIDREGLYTVITALQQNVFMLDDTLKNNITLYRNYSDEEYRDALRKASLLDLEKRLPNGSNTVLGEGGNTISGGERQRVSIARSVLKGCGVMIMDEATASLDNATACEIESAIVGMEGLTCIFVTHRYSADILRRCDGILVIKDGELIEHGTFDEMCDAKGYFYSLYNVL